MDSNFSVKITADISELQARLASVEAVTEKFSKSMDRAAASVKNMEQNANRGRLTAFAFGQVIRDVGFFSQSFSLGLLAISNNIPILVDQIALSVKALQPFAGAISIASSVLTAALTIWAYSAAATEKATEANEDYMQSLDGVSKMSLVGQQNARAEIITLDLLYKTAKNTTLSLKQRKEAASEMQELYPAYFGNLSQEKILAGEVGAAYETLKNEIVQTARARAGLDILTENAKKQLELEKRITDARAAKTAQDKVGLATQQLYNAGSVEASKIAEKNLATARVTALQTLKGISDIEKLPVLQMQLNQLKKEDLAIVAEINKAIENGGKVTGKVDEGVKETGDLWKDFSNTLKAINADQTTTDLEKLNQTLSAHRSMLEKLSKETYSGVSDDVKTLSDEMVRLKSEITGLENTKKANDLLSQFNLKLKDIQSTTGATASSITKNTIEAVDDLINKLTDLGGFDALIAKLAQVKASLVNTFNTDIATENLQKLNNELWNIIESGAAQLIGNSFMAMGEAIAMGGNVAAAAGQAIFGTLSSVLSQFADKLISASLAGLLFSKAMKNIFDSKNWGLALAAGIALKVAAGAAGGFARSLSGGGGGMGGGMDASPTPSFGGINTFSANTSMNAPSSIASTITSQPVLETRVSGNDLVILMNRSSNTRNSYY